VCSFFVVDPNVAVNNVNIVDMEMAEQFRFALLSRYSTFRTALNNVNVLMSSCKVPDTFVRF
jgi:hypothetical protein